MTNELTVGSLFSGIGGLDLGLERAGMRVIWQSEIDPYATRVLAKHWPGVPNYGDITKLNWRDVVRPDVICGGYPCQPFSTAGKRRGEDDPRHLWPYVRDAISHLRPRYAILENVRGHLSLGGLSVISEITALGYCAEWRIISAASVGANHRRDRLVIVAHSNSSRMEGPRPELKATRPSRSSKDTQQLVADTAGGDGRNPKSQSLGEVFGQAAKLRECDRNLGSVANWWTTEPDVGRVAHGVPSRVDRLKGLGNAVVPQVAEVIGRLVVAHART